jgi:hypothetical protein
MARLGCVAACLLLSTGLAAGPAETSITNDEHPWVNLPSSPLQFRVDPTRNQELFLENQMEAPIRTFTLGCVSHEGGRPKTTHRFSLTEASISARGSYTVVATLHGRKDGSRWSREIHAFSREASHCAVIGSKLAVVEVQFADYAVWAIP